MQKQIQKSIDPQKQYTFPAKIKIVHHNSKIIVIAVETGNWIILENEPQLEFFNLLKENTLSKSLELFKGEQKDAVQTVIQLEARRFENDKVARTATNKVMMYLTNGCNMRCPHCYMYADYKKENELTCDEIIKFLSELKNCGIQKVTFSGGEVTIRNDFVEIINRTYDLGYKIEVLTNGVLWTDAMIIELAPKLSEVQISIDGYCETENAIVRGKGNFDKALLAVEKFVSCETATRIAVTPLFDDNFESKVDSYVKFANELLEKYKDKNFDILFTGELIKGREIDLGNEAKHKYAKVIEKIYEQTTHFSKENNFIARHKKFEILDNCSFGNLYISSVGDVYACSRLSDIKPFANLRKDSFEKIMDISNKAKAISNIDNLEPCKQCELKYICGGGCRLIYFQEMSKISSFENIKISPRKCSPGNKKYFYDLMIKTNKDIFQ